MEKIGTMQHVATANDPWVAHVLHGAAGLTWLLTNSQFNVLCTQLGLSHSLDVTDEKHFAPVGGWSWLSVGDGWSSVGFGPISDWSGSSSKAMLN